MPLFSGQQTIHLGLQRNSNANSNGSTTPTPILRTSAEYAPAPSSASGLSELASLMNNNNNNNFNNNNNRPSASSASAPIAPSLHSHSHQHQHQQQHQQQHRSSMTSRSGYSSSGNNNISRNAASLLSPRVTPSMVTRPVSIDTTNVILPLTSTTTYSNSNSNSFSDQAPQKPPRRGSEKTMRAAESGKGSILPMRGAGTGAPPQPQRTIKQKRDLPGRSKSYGATLPRTRQDISGNNNSNNTNNTNTNSMKAKLAYLRRRTATASSDDEFESASQKVRSNSTETFDNNNNNNNNNNTQNNAQNDGYFSHRNSTRTRPQRQNGSGVSVSSVGSGGSGNGSNKKHYGNHRRNSSGGGNSGGGCTGGVGTNCQYQLIKLSRLKLGHVLQVVIVLAVIALVYESHHKALFATQQLTQFKDEESLLLLHLQKIEQQSIQLHENLSRLARVGIGGGGGGDGGSYGDDELAIDGADGGGNSGGGGRAEVDFDLIHKQTQQLYQMEEELSHEVKTLQTRIQLSARNHIIQEFGEGPVQVVLELDFGDATTANNNANANTGPHRISILLWHDTPHAAWTWLEQIGDHVWDGAEFTWQQGHIIDAVPPPRHPEKDGGNIEFVEHSQHAHQAWTVGVRENSNTGNTGGSGNARGAMSMYINLQDNSKLHKHETCVGKVIDGFDALQKLLEAARSNNGDEGNNDSSNIVIRKATAMHYVTKKPGMG